MTRNQSKTNLWQFVDVLKIVRFEAGSLCHVSMATVLLIQTTVLYIYDSAYPNIGLCIYCCF